MGPGLSSEQGRSAERLLGQCRFFRVSGLVCGGLPPLSGWPIRLQAITPAQSKPGSCHFFVPFGLFRA